MVRHGLENERLKEALERSRMEAEDLRTQLQTTKERLTRTVGIADGLFFERVANRDRIEVLEDFATALTHRNEFAMMAMRESIDPYRPMSTRVELLHALGRALAILEDS